MGNITKKFIFNDLVLALMQDLTNREKEVITQRFSLDGQSKTTLQEIGRGYGVTRERVRQIESDALKKVIKTGLEGEIIEISDLNKISEEFMSKNGGFISHNHLMDLLLHTDDEKEFKALDFLLKSVVSKNFSTIKEPFLDIIIKTKDIDDEVLVELFQALHDYIVSKNEPISFEELLNNVSDFDKKNHIDKLSAQKHEVLEALLKAHKHLDTNILDKWGTVAWPTIKPKRMTDKAYLVMLKTQKPLHFEECAELINQANFDKKKACAATVHNELILDDKYVLVGRGMYALKDWGYETGTVSDIITRILKKNGPLTKKEISEKVLKQRVVQNTTITLALMNKDRFVKQENATYALV